MRSQKAGTAVLLSLVLTDGVWKVIFDSGVQDAAREGGGTRKR